MGTPNRNQFASSGVEGLEETKNGRHKVMRGFETIIEYNDQTALNHETTDLLIRTDRMPVVAQ